MTRFLTSLSVVVCVALPGCSESMPPASPHSDVREVHVHRAEDKPDLIRLERDGDPTAALAAAYLHGASITTSRAIGQHVTQQLANQHYVASVTPTEGALLVSVSVGDDKPRGNLVAALRGALEAGRQPAQGKSQASPEVGGLCGSLTSGAIPAPVSRVNTVLAAVGSAARVQALQSDYETAEPWPDGPSPAVGLPGRDEFTTGPSIEPSELIVAIRTPLRARVLPAARAVGAPQSMLRLLATSHAGDWQMMTSHASFIPAGGCLAVHLGASQAVDALHAARAAKAVARELDWILSEQTPEEDPRFNVLQAPSAEDAARRAAWEAVTRIGVSQDAASTTYLHYRGNVDTQTWQSLIAAKSEPPAIPVTTHDEHGQGRIWAQLESPCSLPAEDNATAGHTTAALLAAAHAVPGVNLELLSGWDNQGLVGWQSTHQAGAEDRLAEGIARSILVAMETPALARRLVRQDQSELDTPAWTLALTLATNGHPSWLSLRPTPQSRALFDGAALETALRRFAGGPLQLRVLTNHGQPQAARLGMRLAHLLSGVHALDAPCTATDLGLTSAPSGEYDVDAEDVTSAVALYVVDRRFATAVRQLASALNRPGGWLRQAVQPLGAQVTATGLGTPARLAALGFTISAETRETMDAALSQLRTLVANLANAPSGSLAAAAAAHPSTPAERLAKLGRGDASESDSVSALVAEGLTERRLYIVRPVALPVAPSSRDAK